MRVCKRGCDVLDSRVFLKNYFIKALEYFFCVYIASSKHLGVGRILERELLPYMGYIRMCGPRGYGFSRGLVINRVSNLAISVIWYGFCTLVLN